MKERFEMTNEKLKKRLNELEDATQHINELERQNQEQLRAIKNLTEENERLRVSYLHVIV